ncbi:uncharacterized protein LOC128745923 [Sabethes cyaneus]|uniref:uncharacterized protein LOC128745923 n=1 Tax=Sabethes cyaneus TaxID=53552 RepID=UPI00237D5895|nr:uncharacterized protein LOC128745923 [Sabethes cyaneus]
MSADMTLTELHKLLKREIQSSKDEIQSSIMGMKNELQRLSCEVDEVKQSQSFINAEFENFKKSITTTTEGIKRMDVDMTSLKASQVHISSQLVSMDRDISYIQQEQLSNNMLISNVIKTADLCAIVCKICELLEIELLSRDIFTITRLTTRNTKQIEPIIIQFSNRIVKEKIMAAAKNITLSCRNLGFPIDQRIYFNHHLTAKNQSLLKVARTYKRQYNYKFAWFNKGYIYIKKDENSSALRILSREDLPSGMEQ